MDSVSHGRAPRVEWVDTAKGLGILLMFYGHVIQSRASAGNLAAVDQLRLIYSFHMPLFFVLAGFFFRPAAQLGQRVRQLALQRLVPVVFFGLLLLPVWAAFAVRHDLPWSYYVRPLGLAYLRGRPELDWVTWFLVCMFVCELMALWCLPRLKSVAAQLLFAAACLWGGVLLCNHGDAFEGWLGAVSSVWFVREAIVALGFYTIGHALYPLAIALSSRRWVGLGLIVACVAGVMSTYRLNHPHEALAVMMAAAEHGDVVDFVFTALAGTLGMVSVSQLLPQVRWVGWVGRNALPLLGLNGVMFHFLNHKLAEIWPLADRPLDVTLYVLVITSVSLLACVPLVKLMNRYVPQLVGQVHVSGPWFPALDGGAGRARRTAAT